ncbi:unnamed protein product [Phyllotreta striolata]|uniref:sn-1-specific diacylglycerol lipase ABHD11 n=1 Tax=Phyllotreta striolata TaxID=444603 RepID=A0A9N9TSM3_PHYSR|nr:unnamed protein product [Phyllotreta striolata]
MSLFLKIKKALFSFQYNKQVFLISRCASVSTSNTLEPIDMAYATFETTFRKGGISSPFVIIHGLFGSKSNWNSMCKVYNDRCCPSRKIVAVDVRNHGESPHTDSHTYAHMVSDIRFLIDQLYASRVSLMGHSMGGRAAMLFALKYPECVERLIVVDISPIRDSPQLFTMPSIFQTLERVVLPTNVPMSTCRAIVDEELSKTIEDKGLRAFLLTNLVEKSQGTFRWRINVPVLLANFNNLAKFPILNDLQYSGPTLFIGGSKSDYLKCAYSTVKPRNNALGIAYNSYETTNTYSDSHPAPVPLIILHGVLGSKSNWNSMSKRIHQQTKAKVIAVDARNHGDSPHYKEHNYDVMAVDLKTFMEKMNIKKANILGHSMGGKTAMLFALKYQDMVNKLLVVDISPISTSTTVSVIPSILKSLRNLQIPSNKPLRDARRIVGDNLMNMVRNRLLIGFLLTNLVQKNDGSYGWRFNTKAILENFDKITSFPQTHNIKFEGPTLFIGGSKSDHIQKSDFPKIQKLFPNSEMKFIEGAGHWLHSEKPAEFLEITLDFLNRSQFSQAKKSNP